jgi:multidrug efflux pump subunit AcrB
LNSEEYTIKVRPYLKHFLLTKYPDLKIRLLEDPPGPPVRATFLVKIKSNASPENLEIFKQKVEKEIRKIAKKEELVDVLNSSSNPKRKINIKLDNESISRA